MSGGREQNWRWIKSSKLPKKENDLMIVEVLENWPSIRKQLVWREGGGKGCILTGGEHADVS